MWTYSTATCWLGARVPSRAHHLKQKGKFYRLGQFPEHNKDWRKYSELAYELVTFRIIKLSPCERETVRRERSRTESGKLSLMGQGDITVGDGWGRMAPTETGVMASAATHWWAYANPTDAFTQRKRLQSKIRRGRPNVSAFEAVFNEKLVPNQTINIKLNTALSEAPQRLL